VCRFRPERRLTALTAACNATAQEIQASLWDSGFDAACDRGEFTSHEILSLIQHDLGFSGGYEQLGQIWALAFEPDLSVLAVARALRDRCRVGLLTNNGPIPRDALPVAYPQIAAAFSPMIFSCDLRAVKPEPEVFAAALRTLGEPPENVLLVDDSAANLEAACSAGLKGLPFANAHRWSAISHGSLAVNRCLRCKGGHKTPPPRATQDGRPTPRWRGGGGAHGARGSGRR